METPVLSDFYLHLFFVDRTYKRSMDSIIKYCVMHYPQWEQGLKHIGNGEYRALGENEMPVLNLIESLQFDHDEELEQIYAAIDASHTENNSHED